MLGFIKKDILMLKNSFKTYLIILIVYTILTLAGEMDISFILPFFAVMLILSTFSYDNYNKWDAYAITLPNGRRNVVLAKYVTTILFLLASFVIAFLLEALVSIIKTSPLALKDTFLSISVTSLATIVILTIMYPIIFKFGIEKGRIIIFVLVFGFIFLGGVLLRFINLENVVLPSFLTKYGFLIAILVTLLILVGSYFLSKRIYSKKEF